MNKSTSLWIAATLLATPLSGLAQVPEKMEAAVAKVEADLDGATVGKWTMDLDAAKKLAAETKLPILLDFSGSDWCGWCKVMEENVFTQPEWAAYATNNLIMVLLDFPSDKSRVPEKYVARNEALQTEYGVQGFPTFVVLDDDGETELGRLGSGRDKTPASFQGELQALFSNRPAAIAKYAESLSPEARAEFDALNATMAKQKAASKAAKAEVADAQQRAADLEELISKSEEELQDFRVSQLSEAQQKEYKELKASFESKEKELQDWLATQPDRSEENMKKFQTMQTELQSLGSKLETY